LDEALPGTEAADIDYRQFLEETLDAIYAVRLPVPDIPHEEVLRRELARKKPFSSSGGYRDLLIWESALRYVASEQEDAVFVSANTKDFADGDQLHADLLADLEARGLTARLSYLPSLGDFNQQHVIPHLQRIDDLERELERRSLGKLDLHGWVVGHAEHILTEEDLLAHGMGIHPDHGSAAFSRVVGEPEIDIGNVVELEPGTYLADLSVRLQAEFCAAFNSDDYEMSAHVREWLGEDPGAFSYTSLEGVQNQFFVQINIRIEGSPPRITTYHVEEVQARWHYWDQRDQSSAPVTISRRRAPNFRNARLNTCGWRGGNTGKTIFGIHRSR
jgi:hypothetical protein